LQPENQDEYTITERNNLVKWDLTLESGEERKLPFSFMIEYPDNKSISVQTKEEK